MAEHCVDNERDLNQILEIKERVIVLLYATWCPFCIRFLPVFNRVSTEYLNNKTVLFLLAQDNQEIIADKFKVGVVPTVLFFEKGVVSKRLDGRLGIGLVEREFTEFLEKCII